MWRRLVMIMILTFNFYFYFLHKCLLEWYRTVGVKLFQILYVWTIILSSKKTHVEVNNQLSKACCHEQYYIRCHHRKGNNQSNCQSLFPNHSRNCPLQVVFNYIYITNHQPFMCMCMMCMHACQNFRGLSNFRPPRHHEQKLWLQFCTLLQSFVNFEGENWAYIYIWTHNPTTRELQGQILFVFICEPWYFNFMGYFGRHVLPSLMLTHADFEEIPSSQV